MGKLGELKSTWENGRQCQRVGELDPLGHGVPILVEIWGRELMVCLLSVKGWGCAGNGISTTALQAWGARLAHSNGEERREAGQLTRTLRTAQPQSSAKAVSQLRVADVSEALGNGRHRGARGPTPDREGVRPRPHKEE
jgi:hypothetical protein